MWSNSVKPNRKEWASADTETRSSSPAVISPFGLGWSLCFLHVLVIVKHNNGFYKSQFTSLVMWIIQPEWQREGERECCSTQVGPTPEMAGDRRWHFVWIIYLIPFNFFPSLPHSPSLSTSITYKRTYTHCKQSLLFHVALITVAQAVKLSSDE